MKLNEINLGFTLGSKQHHDAVAALRQKTTNVPTGHFIKQLVRSTIPVGEMEEIRQMLADSGKTSITRDDISLMAIATGANEEELLMLAGLL